MNSGTQITLRDGCFPRGCSMGLGGDNEGERPRLVEWVRVAQGERATFYTDICLKEAVNHPRPRVAWLIECPGGPRTHYDVIDELWNEFDYVLTFCKDLLDRPGALFYPFGGSWIHPRQYRLERDKAGVSMLYSAKDLLPGHTLRHEIASRFGDRLSLFGAGCGRPIASKAPALAPFLYSIIIEPWRGESYFTEKLIDCLCVGTVPVYWGAPDVGDFFDPDGILSFETLDELAIVLDSLSPADYERRLKSVRYNLGQAQKYRCAEDWFFSRYPFLLKMG